MTDAGRVPAELAYTKTHEWVRANGRTITVGITDHAQSQLTDIVFVDLPAPGKAYAAGGTVLVLESVKTVSDVYAPVGGRLASVNADLKAHPEFVNQEPYGKGWLFTLETDAPVDPKSLLSAAQYSALVTSESG